MPPVSEAQRRAMQAAAHGNSRLGIPKAVGEEFVAKDANGHAAGILFVAPDGDILLLRRSSTEENFAGHWALPGGKAEDGETPEAAADRETQEEMGGAPAGSKKLLDQRVTPTGMAFHTFAQPVADKFAPKLNGEHSGYAWAPLSMLPQPIHPAVAATLQERLQHDRAAADMTPEDWQGLTHGMLKWLSEEQMESEHAEDAAILAFDRAPIGMEKVRRAGLAFDRGTVRTYDQDGRLHVSVTNISKANICGYLGREIPDFEALGLDPDKIYNLLRDPDELAKAAPTFNNLPLLSEHVPVSAADHQPDLVLGSTGTDAVFESPYLRNSLVVWAKDGIDGISSEAKKELSSSYRYRADMTPGTYMGEPFHGTMRDIIGNHVALVEEGRAGADVVVGDSKKELTTMKTVLLTRKAALLSGAAHAHLAPKLAKDAKLDLSSAFAGVTSKNSKDKRSAIVAGITKAAEGKLAKDASIDAKDLEKVLDVIEAIEPSEVGTADAMETDPNSGEPLPMKKDAKDAEPGAKREFLASKLSAEDLKSYDELPDAAMDEDDDEKKKREEEEKKKAAAEDEEKKAMVTKPAMDAAIKAATEATEKRVMKNQQDIRVALDEARPYVGELSSSLAFDSAEGVYRHVLGMLQVPEAKTIHASALPTILKMQPKAGARESRPTEVLGMDSSQTKTFHERFPDASRLTS